MMRMPAYPDCDARLTELATYRILDSPRTQEFDDLAALAAAICGTPLALVSLIDRDRQWFKSAVGIEVEETPLHTSICAHAILEEGLFEVENLCTDERFRDMALVLGGPEVKFYAGTPLISRLGLPLGTLCVLDTVPRQLNEFQRETLETLGRQVMALMESHRLAAELLTERTSASREEMAAELRSIEARFRGAIESSPDGFMVLECVRGIGGEIEDFVWTHANETAAAIVGRPRNWFLGRRMLDVLPGHREVGLFDDYVRVTETGEPFTTLLTYAYDGIDAFFRITAVRVENGFAVTFADLSDHKRVEQELRESEGRYRTLFEHIKEGFSIVEMLFDEAGLPYDYRLVEINPAFERLTGISFEKAMSGKTVRELVPNIEEFWIQTYGQVALTGRAASFVNRAEGLGRSFEVDAVRVGGEGSARVAVVFNEVSARIEAEAERDRVLNELTTEREKLKSLFEQAPAFIAVLRGSDYAFDYVNEAYYGLVGHRKVIGVPLLEAMPDLENQGFVELLDEVVRSGEPFIGTAMPVLLQRIPEAPLEIRFVDLTYQPAREVDGSIYGVLVHGVDVTNQVLARRGIVESEELLRTIFEQAIDDAIVVLDVDQTILAWNPAAERICGWKAEEVIGRPFSLIFTAEDLASGDPELPARAALGEGKFTDERLRLRKDGTWFWSSGTISTLHHPSGSVRGFLTVFRDATERNEAERRIRDLNNQLEEKVVARTAELEAAVKEAESFSYSIAHDFRSPLRAIAANSRILLDEVGPELSEEHRARLVRQSHNATRLGLLIDELLRLSRLARVPVVREKLDMTAEARSVADELGTTCEVIVQEGMFAQADPKLVRLVLQNLLENAIKFSPENTKVYVGSEDGVFWVRDLGVGFDMKYAPKIFLPFERLVRESEFPGTGIGLANVDRIVKRHGGRIWAESELGKGSTFSFTLES